MIDYLHLLIYAYFKNKPIRKKRQTRKLALEELRSFFFTEINKTRDKKTMYK